MLVRGVFLGLPQPYDPLHMDRGFPNILVVHSGTSVWMMGLVSHGTLGITCAPIETHLTLPLQLPQRAPTMQSGPTDWPKLLWERRRVQTKSLKNFQQRGGIGPDCSCSDG